jgi:hypothetical protein
LDFHRLDTDHENSLAHTFATFEIFCADVPGHPMKTAFPSLDAAPGRRSAGQKLSQKAAKITKV